MEKTEMIKERIALFIEIKQACQKKMDINVVGEDEIISIFQEVCKDDRMAKIHAEKMHQKIPIQTFKIDEPATEKQLDYLRRLKIIAHGVQDPKLTKAEASRLIDEKVSKGKPKNKAEWE